MKITIHIPDELVPYLKLLGGDPVKYVENILLAPLLERYAKSETDVLLSNKIEKKVMAVREKVVTKEIIEKSLVVTKEK